MRLKGGYHQIPSTPSTTLIYKSWSKLVVCFFLILGKSTENFGFCHNHRWHSCRNHLVKRNAGVGMIWNSQEYILYHPWDWYIYVHAWLIFTVNVIKCRKKNHTWMVSVLYGIIIFLIIANSRLNKYSDHLLASIFRWQQHGSSHIET